MPKTRRQKICGNCICSVVSKSHGVLIKSFKCDRDMEWVAFDETCDDHAFEYPTPVTEQPKKNPTKSEAIDLGGIPESIRTETGAELQRDAEDPTSTEE